MGDLCPGRGSLSREEVCQGDPLERDPQRETLACTTGHMTWGGLCPGRGFCPERSLYGGSLSREGVCQGDPLERDPQRDPLYGNERTVRVLLECILVYKKVIVQHIL